MAYRTLTRCYGAGCDPVAASSAAIIAQVLTPAVAGVISFNTRQGVVTLLSADVTTALGFTPTNAAVVPSTAPAAGQLLVGNAGGTAYAPQSASGDLTCASTGAFTVANSAITSAKLATGLTLSGLTRCDAHYGGITTDADAATITFDMSLTNIHTTTLGGNRTLAVSNTQTGQCFIIRLTQDGTGSRTVTWFSGISWAGGSAPTLTTTAGKTDVFSFMQTGAGAYDGFIVGQNV